MKANELSKSLRDLGFEEAEVERLVKSRMDDGSIEAEASESTDTPSLDPEILDEAVLALKKSMSVSPEEDAAPSLEAAAEEATTSISKGDGSPEDVLEDNVVDPQALSLIAKGADRIVQRVDDQHRVLSQAVIALGHLTQEVAKAMGTQRDTTAEIGARVEQLSKALNLPAEPRTVTGSVEAVPSPGEAGTVPALTRQDVVTKANTLLQDPKIAMARAHQLAEAVAMLDSGGDPQRIASTYAIPVA